MSVPLFRAETIRPDLSDRDLADYLRSYLTGTLAALKEEQRGVLGGGRAACRKYSDAMDNVVSALHDRARATYLSSAADLKYLLAVIPLDARGAHGFPVRRGNRPVLPGGGPRHREIPFFHRGGPVHREEAERNAEPARQVTGDGLRPGAQRQGGERRASRPPLPWVGGADQVQVQGPGRAPP